MKKHVNRKYIKKCVAFYKEILGITHDVDIKWGSVSDDDYAEVTKSPEYHKHRINVNLDNVTSKKDARNTVLHELLHVLISNYTHTAQSVRVKGVRKLLNDAEEDLVTRMEKLPIFSNLRP